MGCNAVQILLLTHPTRNAEMTSFLKKTNNKYIIENIIFILILSKKKDVISLSLPFLRNIS